MASTDIVMITHPDIHQAGRACSQIQIIVFAAVQKRELFDARVYLTLVNLDEGSLSDACHTRLYYSVGLLVVDPPGGIT